MSDLQVETVAQTSVGVALHQQSTSRVARIGSQSPSGEGSLRLKGGSSDLINRLRDRVLASGRVNIIYNVQVTDIIDNPSTSSSPNYTPVRVKGINSLDKTSPSSTPDEALSFPCETVIVALPPKLAIKNIKFTPLLSKAKREAMRTTPTWMDKTGKVAFVYESAFWKDSGYSGTVFSKIGPLSQIWDNSISNSGTTSSSAIVSYKDMKVKEYIISLKRETLP